jgi:predicted nucleotidyltransferase
LKKYFYVLRPLLCIQFIREKNTGIPPVTLLDLISSIQLPTHKFDAIHNLLQRKLKIPEDFKSNEMERIVELDTWMDELLIECQNFVKSMPFEEDPPLDEFNAFLCNTILIKNDLHH